MHPRSSNHQGFLSELSALYLRCCMPRCRPSCRRSFIAATAPNGSTTSWSFKYRPDSYSSVAFFYFAGIYDPRVTPEEEALWRFPEQRMPGREVWIEQPALLKSQRAATVSARREEIRFCLHKSCTVFETAGQCGAGEWMTLGLNMTEGLWVLQAMHVLGPTAGVWNASLSSAETGAAVLIDDKDWVTLDSRDSIKYPEQVAINYPENRDLGTLADHRLGVVNITTQGVYALRLSCVAPSAQDQEHGMATGRLILDSVYARRLTISDPWGWVQDYLAQELVYQQEQRSKAEADVARIATAAERYAAAHSAHYPAEVEGAVVPKELLSQSGVSSGLDPYHQLYLYRSPGLCNPWSVDVFTRTGDSTRPADWLGNWQRPFAVGRTAATGVFGIEGESMAVHARSSAVMGAVPQRVESACNAPMSNSSLLFIRAPREAPLDDASHWIELSVNAAAAAGSYDVWLLLVSSWNYGRVAWELCSGDENCVGGVADGFTADCAPDINQTYLGPNKIGRFVSAANGTLKVTSESHALRSHGQHDLERSTMILRIQITDKAERSSGFDAGVDALVLREAKDRS
jgi:hypothetical protein|eukprot:COSAG06_NODE_1952_length_7992_cov_4.274294_8_plen_574_part_00